MSDINLRDLDRYITGNWGEDSIPQIEPMTDEEYHEIANLPLTQWTATQVEARIMQLYNIRDRALKLNCGFQVIEVEEEIDRLEDVLTERYEED